MTDSADESEYQEDSESEELSDEVSVAHLTSLFVVPSKYC